MQNVASFKSLVFFCAIRALWYMKRVKSFYYRATSGNLSELIFNLKWLWAFDARLFQQICVRNSTKSGRAAEADGILDVQLAGVVVALQPDVKTISLQTCNGQVVGALW